MVLAKLNANIANPTVRPGLIIKTSVVDKTNSLSGKRVPCQSIDAYLFLIRYSKWVLDFYQLQDHVIARRATSQSPGHFKAYRPSTALSPLRRAEGFWRDVIDHHKSRADGRQWRNPCSPIFSARSP